MQRNNKKMFPIKAFLVTTSLCCLIEYGYGKSLDVAAFNIQVFGQAKVSNKDVVTNLVRIILRYDLVFIQEIRDSSEQAIYTLLEAVNSDASEGSQYEVLVSSRLGRTSSKEQYGYMYRAQRLTVLDKFVYNDSLHEVFEREPYIVQFKDNEQTSLPSFFLIGCHVRPSDAFSEIQGLYQVFREAVAYFGNENGLALGDFNADCSYVSQKSFNNLNFSKDANFTWLISNDTTTAASDCAYDRFVAPNSFVKYVKEGSVAIFDFGQEFALNVNLTCDISDHYPIVLSLVSPHDQSSGGTLSLPSAWALLVAYVSHLL